MIALHRPAIQRRELEAVLESLVNDQVGPGSLSQKLSSRFEKLLFADESRVFRDRLTAGHFLWMALGLGAGDGILISPLGARLLAYSARLSGLDVFFADVQADVPVLDPQSVQKALTDHPQIKLIVADHPYGLIPDVGQLRKLGVMVLEEVRWGLGGMAEMEHVGSRGNAALVSLEDDGVVCAGGGEVLLLRGREPAQRFKQALQQVPEQVFLSDINAALGLAQLEQQQSQVARRREMWERWAQSFRRDSGHLVVQPTEFEPVLSHFVFRAHNNVSEIIAYGRKKGVVMRQAFQDAAYLVEPSVLEELTNAAGFLGRTLLYPLYPALSANEQKTLLSVLSSLP